MRKRIQLAALLALAALVLWWLGRAVDWAGVRKAIAGANIQLLVAATMLVYVTYLLRACRWQALLAPLAQASIRELFASTVIGFSAVFLFGRAGELTRPVVLPLRERRVRLSASIMTIMVERLFDLTAVALLFALNLLWFKPPAASETDFSHMRWGGLLLLSAIACGLMMLVLFKKRAGNAAARLEGKSLESRFLMGHLKRLLAGAIVRLKEALSVLTNGRQILVLIAWTGVVWLVSVATSWLVMRAFGLPFGPAETLFVMCWGLVGSLVPTPGGAAGAFHAATTAGLILLGVTLEKATAVSIIVHLITFSPALACGLYYFVRGNLELGDLRPGASGVANATQERMMAESALHLATEGSRD